MKRYRYNHITPLAVMTVIVAVAVWGCSRSRQPGAADSGTDSTSNLPQVIRVVTKAVSQGDAQMFAASVSYPLARPYPLKDITDSAEMVAYYPTLVDDSLRHVISHAEAHRWSDNDYRGWTLDNGEYVWIDDSVYSVNYTSVAEQTLRAMLQREEMESLEEPLRPGWSPAFCLYGIDNGTIYRVDVSDRPVPGDSTQSVDTTGEGILVLPDAAASNDSCLYRLAIYPEGTDLHGRPALTMTGRLIIEGSEGTRVYYFDDDAGDTAEYVYDQQGDEPDDAPAIIIVRSGRTHRHPVRRAYWRDYLTRGRK